ncbi:D-alanyl-D-alanine carboxypeptidase family protein [Roseivivax sp. CAU 1761]
MVMDARSGEVYYSENADTRLHPASLTKMMTLYIAFEAVEHGEISMDTEVRISRNAAAEPPSKLGLRSGQTIKLRYLVRAAAVKSANDAATAIGEAISGSEAAFARRMNRTAKALGMTRTTFKNAHGLTAEGHLSTARDMTLLGRHMIYDYPEYYNLFSRVTADAGIRHVSHTNRRMLESYPGADGIKTGYTQAAGFNLVASADRGGERVIATVFGGRSTASRNAQVAKLLDLGFQKAPQRVALQLPGRPAYHGNSGINVEVARDADPTAGRTGRAIRQAVAAVPRSLRPMPRPGAEPAPLVASLKDDIESVLAEAQSAPVGSTAAVAVAAAPARPLIAEPATARGSPVAAALESVVAQTAAATGNAAPEAASDAAATVTAAAEAPAPEAAPAASTAAVIAAVAAAQAAPGASVKPRGRPAGIVLASVTADAPAPAAAAAPEPVALAAAGAEDGTEVISRVSTSGGRHWGINVGRYPSRYAAEKVLLQTALQEMQTLDGTLRKVVHRPAGFDANFMGMSRDAADLACRKLQARQVTCFMIGPS